MGEIYLRITGIGCAEVYLHWCLVASSWYVVVSAAYCAGAVLRRRPGKVDSRRICEEVVVQLKQGGGNGRAPK